MPSLLDIAWLIPFAPFAGAFFVLILLVSFNRTMNRLSKPVSYWLIACVSLSAVISFALFDKKLSGNVFDWDLNIANFQYHLGLYIDNLSSLISTICCLTVFLLMAFSYFSSDRKKGYVLYFVSLGFSCGVLLFLILSGTILQVFL